MNTSASRRARMIAGLLGVMMLAALPATLSGQDLLRPERLPANATLYLYWAGAASSNEVRSPNRLVRLWNDPAFVPAREQLLELAFADLLKTGVPREVLQALLESAALAGSLDLAPQQSGNTKTAPSGEFTIVEARVLAPILLRQYRDRPPEKDEGEEEPEQPVVTRERIAGIEVEKRATSKQTDYLAVVGGYFLRTGSREAAEAMLAWLQSAEPPAKALAGAPAFQRARAWMAPGASFELFVQFPKLKTEEIPPVRGMNVGAMLGALHLERIESFSTSVSFAGEATRFRLALLGDSAPGSLFDLAGESRGEFATLAAVPADAVAYNAWRVDLAALYGLARTAARSLLPQEQTALVEAVEGLIAGQIGMSLPEALGLFDGEMASVSLDARADPLDNLYALAIREPDTVLTLVRTLFGERIGSESRDGAATFLAVSVPYTDPDTGAQRQRFHHVGVAPLGVADSARWMLLIGPSRALLRETSRRLASGAAVTKGIPAQVLAARRRAGWPERLSGLSYGDLTRVDWKKLAEELRKPDPDESKRDPRAEAAKIALAEVIASGLLGRFLRTSAGAWWKDASGIYVDASID